MFLQAIFYCSFFKETMLEDAWFLFHLAIQLVEIQTPEVLFGNLILKCTDEVKARPFTLLPSVSRASPRTFQNNLVAAPGLRRN